MRTHKLFSLVLVLGFAMLAIAAEAATVSIRNLTLKHGSKLSPQDEASILQELKSQSYDSNNFAIGERIRYSFQRRGYFKVFVNEPEVTVINSNNGSRVVDVAATIGEGDIYRLSDLIFRGLTVINADELRNQFKIVPGDIFDRDKIAEGLDGLRRLYVSKGYPDFAAVPETDVDGAKHTISLVIHLDPGTQRASSKKP